MVLALARIWFRQHQLEETEGDPGINKVPGWMMSEKIPNEDINEPKGRKLKQALKSPEQLAQLMFSALLLHWNVHASRCTVFEGCKGRNDMPVGKATSDLV